MESPVLSVDSYDLAFSAFACASHDLDGVSLTNGNSAHFVLSSEVLVQVGAHDLSS